MYLQLAHCDLRSRLESRPYLKITKPLNINTYHGCIVTPHYVNILLNNSITDGALITVTSSEEA